MTSNHHLNDIATDPASAAESQYGRRRTVVLIVSAVVFVGLIFALPRAWTGRQTFDAPRDNVGFQSAVRVAAGKSMAIPLRHNEILPPDIARALTPRDAANIGGKAVPIDFAGSVLLWIGLVAVWKPLALFLSPVLALISGILVLRIAQELFDLPKDAGLRAKVNMATWWLPYLLALWFAHPGLLFNGSGIYGSEMPSLVLVLAVILFFLRFWRSERTADFAWMTVAAGAAVAVRYPNVITFIPLAVVLLVTRKVGIRHVAIAVAIVTPFAAVVLGFNHAVYGSATDTGYGLVNRVLRQTLNPPSRGVLGISDRALFRHLFFYIFQLPLVLGVPLLGAVVGTPRAVRTNRSLRPALVAILAASVLSVGYHAGLDTFGSVSAAVNASFVRYMLPIVGVWMTFVAFAVATDEDRPTQSARVICMAVIVTSLVTATVGPFGIVNRWRMIGRHEIVRAGVIALTPPDALIASRLSDRDVFPERQTLTMTYLLENRDSSSVNPNISVWDNLPSPRRFASIAGRIRALGIPLYLINDFMYPRLADIDTALRREGLRLDKQSSLAETLPQLYAIVPVSNP
jgi:hypothetical protein